MPSTIRHPHAIVSVQGSAYDLRLIVLDEDRLSSTTELMMGALVELLADIAESLRIISGSGVNVYPQS